MTYLIEKSIPLTMVRGGKWKSQYREMEPGDSFLVPDGDMLNGIKSAQSSICQSAKAIGCKIATRSVEGGLRVWLLERPK